MSSKIHNGSILVVSKDIVVREIEGEFIIIPLVGGIGDMDDELFTLNRHARAIWECLDGIKSLGEIAHELCNKYDAPLKEIEGDVLGLAKELVKRNILVESQR